MRRRIAIVIFEVLVGLISVLAIGLAFAMWRISQAPVSLDLAKPYIERALSGDDGVYDVFVGDVSVAWGGWSKPVEFQADDVVLNNREGVNVLRVPGMGLSLSFDALLRGIVAPVALEFKAPHISLSRERPGKWSLQTGDVEGDSQPFAMMNALAAPRDKDSAFGYLEEISVADAELTLIDKVSNVWLVVKAPDIALLRDQGGIKAVADFSINVDRNEIQFSGAGRFNRENNRISAKLDFSNLDPGVLADRLPEVAELQRLDTLLSGQLSLAVEDLSYISVAEGAFSSGSGSLNLPEFYDKPLLFDALSAKARFDAVDDRITIEKLSLTAPEKAVVNVSAKINNLSKGPLISLDAEALNVPVNTLQKYWPESIGPDARQWVVGNLKNGIVPKATLRLDGRMPEPDPSKFDLVGLSGRIDFEGVSTHFLRPLPPVLETFGHASYTEDRFDIFIRSGHLDGLKMEASKVEISGMTTEQAELAVDAAVRGPVADAMAVLASEPFEFTDALGVDPDAVTGKAGARIKLGLPLRHDLKVSDVRIAASAILEDAGIENIFRGHDVTDADVTLDLNGAGMTVLGSALMAGIPTQVNFKRFFHDKGDFIGHLVATGRVLPEQARALGVEPQPYISGPVTLQLSSIRYHNGDLVTSLIGDLRETSVRIREIGWKKPKGAAGTVRAKIKTRDGKVVGIENITAVAADLAVEFETEFNEAGEISMVKIPTARVGRSSFSGEILVVPDRPMKITLVGEVLDIESNIEAMDHDDDVKGEKPDVEPKVKKEPGNPFVLTAQFEKVYIGTETPLKNVETRMNYDGEYLANWEVEGRIGAGRVLLDVETTSQGSTLKIVSSDAGDLLRFFDLTKSVNGGQLDVNGTVSEPFGDIDVKADVFITNFETGEVPALARILTLGSIRGFTDTIQGRGVPFDSARFDVDLTTESIFIRDGLAKGPSLGISLDAKIDRIEKQADIRGMIIPAYSINRLIDKVPVLGKLITGGEKEGLLGQEFIVTGPFDDPDVSVNPLAGLTPGFLRDLFADTGKPGEPIVPSRVSKEEEEEPD